MQDYQYEPVHEFAFEVRFLILLPGERGDPVQGLLLRSPLTKEKFPHYEALSYAWGSLDDPMDVAIRTTNIDEAAILLNDTTSSRVGDIPSNSSPPAFGKVSVTQNLGRALPYLRLQHKPRMLWIDAICVNQKDLPERSRQVQRMADVYRLASRAVVWLGEESHDIELALTTLTWISSKVKYDFSTFSLYTISGNVSDAHWADLNIRIESTVETIISLTDLFRRPWFHRLWVWQEIHLASQTSSILTYGEGEILWQDFRSAIMALMYKLVRTDTIYEWAKWNKYYEHGSKVLKICGEVTESSFESILQDTKSCQCSDPRDRVYALLSLLRPNEVDIQPDYTRTMEDVFQETAISVMHTSSSLDLLCCCELNSKRSKLPSWVPDFSVPKSTINLDSIIMASTLSQRPHITEVLHAQGVQISIVQQLWEFKFSSESTDDETSIELNGFLSEFEIEGRYLNDEEMSEAFVRTLTSNRFQEACDPVHPGFPSFEINREFWNYISTFRIDNTKQHPLHSNRLYSHMRAALTGRSFFVTAKGHIGLCPVFTKLGDVIVFLVGCHTPLTLRPHVNGTYLVVGEAYCHGIMLGEPFLGPLPPGVNYVRELATGRSLFKNQETGETTCEDPRLGDLPPGWSRVEHEQDKWYNIFLDEETGSTHDSFRYDPRTFPEELEKRDVKLEKFRLA